jgi:hypothetical protein
MAFVYIVRCNFSDPGKEQAWNEWYNGPKMAQMLAKPLFLTCQRFRLASGTGRKYLTLWTLQSPQAFETPDYYLQGMAKVYQATKNANGDALRLFYNAIERDANFASAYGMAAWCYAWRKRNGWMAYRATEIAETARLALQAVERARTMRSRSPWVGSRLHSAGRCRGRNHRSHASLTPSARALRERFNGRRSPRACVDPDR